MECPQLDQTSGGGGRRRIVKEYLTKHLEERKKRKIEKEKEKKAAEGKRRKFSKESDCNRLPEGPPLLSHSHSLSLSLLLSLHSSHASANGSKKSNSKPRLEAPHRGDDARSRAPLRRRRLLLVPVPRRNGLPHPAPAGRPSTGRAERGTHPSGRWSLSLVWCW